MTENELLNIKRARLALMDHKDQEALDYYLEAKKENEKNAEAAYWVYIAAWKDYVDTNKSASDKWNVFTVLSNKLTDAVDQIAEMEGTDAEKALVLIAFVYAYTPIVDYVTGSLGTQMASQKDRAERAALTLYWTGNAIERNFNSNDEAMGMACKAWKEGIVVQQKYFEFSYGGNKAEDYAEKIKKIEPEYVMPNKSGCMVGGVSLRI